MWSRINSDVATQYSSRYLSDFGASEITCVSISPVSNATDNRAIPANPTVIAAITPVRNRPPVFPTNQYTPPATSTPRNAVRLLVMSRHTASRPYTATSNSRRPQVCTTRPRDTVSPLDKANHSPTINRPASEFARAKHPMGSVLLRSRSISIRRVPPEAD